MKIIPVKTPALLKTLYSQYTWDFYIQKGKKIYLTFDDGPIPEVTEFVLEQLKKHKAKATFFCIGENIKKNPEIFIKIITDGHSVGNHTMNHLKAWKSDLPTYTENTLLCEKYINQHIDIKDKLFRPPYGQISKTKLASLKKMGYQIILWDVLAKDWDKKTTPEQCLQNVINNCKTGSIVVFHDSLKAYTNLRFALPKTLKHFTEKGYFFDKI